MTRQGWLKWAQPDTVVLSGIFVPSHILQQLVDDQLCATKYEPVVASYVDTKYVGSRALALTKSLAELAEDSTYVPYFGKWWDAHPKGRLFNPIHFNIKTHKPNGKISVRLLHNAGANPLGGLMHIVRLQLSSLNTSLPLKVSCLAWVPKASMSIVLTRNH